MAESILKAKLEAAGLTDQIVVDSAGTGAWHVGELPDPRTRSTGERFGLNHWSRARQVRSADFEEFDLIVAMDRGHVLELHRWPGARKDKVRLMLTFAPHLGYDEVKDPYYGGLDGFEDMYRELDVACDGLLAEIVGRSG